MTKDIKAPMPGINVNIMVNEGDEIAEHQELAIIEAMKMEIPIVSVDSGKVKEILIKVNDSVAAGQPLIIVE